LVNAPRVPAHDDLLGATPRRGRTEHHIGNFTINFGPQHPAAHGVLRLKHISRSGIV
jgi:hypothetical protein